MYKAEIIESSRELTKREALKIKDTTNAVKIDKVVSENEPLVINVQDYALMHVENDQSKTNKEYDQIVVMDENGQKFTTGSPSFMRTFTDIYETLADETPFEIECYKKESKTYEGKYFLTCSVI